MNNRQLKKLAAERHNKALKAKKVIAPAKKVMPNTTAGRRARGLLMLAATMSLVEIQELKEN